MEHYDIFISYKRKSLPTANNLYYRLTTRGYSTFFDLEEMRRDNFNVQLLNYIENAKDVFVILEEGSLDGCKKENWEKEDWFCHEIAFALEKKKNIIPILLGDYKMPSVDFFPDKLKELSLKHSPDFSFSFFDAYLDKLIEKKFITSEAHIQNKATSVFKFYSNENCQVFKEGKLVCSLEGMSNTPYYLPVSRKGEYFFYCKNNKTEDIKAKRITISENEEKIIKIRWLQKGVIIKQLVFFSVVLLFLFFLNNVIVGYVNVKNCNTLESLNSYRPNNIVESLFWGDQMSSHINKIDSIQKAIEAKYDCKLNPSISLDRLDVLCSLLNNMSFVPDYCYECDSIYVCKFEVTETEWASFMGIIKDYYSSAPVTDITIFDARQFIDSLRLYSNINFMLPTYEDWERAAMANKNYLLSGGNNEDSVSWNIHNSNGRKHSIEESDKLMPNSFDLYNMSGNVAEMCSDTIMHDANTYNVIMGGHYNSYYEDLKIHSKDYLKVGESAPNVGIRLIISI